VLGNYGWRIDLAHSQLGSLEVTIAPNSSVD
jgi:hypothetical protein